ncbi:MAG TPA: AI-2E family transporter [Mycobacteriales bacterium]|jgi:predicted PurR-regulated permease PerM|nr:AI-2E family transporter [Mycobacteriales bacterium]
MAAAERPERLRVSNRSVAAFVALVGLTLVLLRMVSAAGRVIGWMLVAATVAGLLDGPVRRLAQRGMPRGRAVLLVAFGALLITGFVTYRVVDDVQAGMKRLREATPAAAERLEASERFGDTARTMRVKERTTEFVDDLPNRLRGGTAAEAFRAAATRGVAFLTTSVLTLFLLSHGRKIASAGVRQLGDERRRKRVARVGAVAYERAFGYARGSLLIGLLAAAVAYAAATVAGVPGAAPLALWVGLWDLVPVVGAVVGAAPIVLLALGASPGRAVVLTLVFLAYQVFEDLVLQPRLENATMRLGPFLTVAAGFAGLELRGLPGALIAVLAVATAVAALDELAPRAGAADAQ